MFTRLFRNSSRRTQTRQPGLRVEVLEDRIVPSTLSLGGNVLTYSASNGIVNSLLVSYDPATQRYTFQDAGETITLVNVPGLGSGSNSVVAGPVAHNFVLIDLGDRDDTAEVIASRPATTMRILAGTGDDTIDVGNAARTLAGIQGDVMIHGQDGVDRARANDYAGPLPGQTYQVTNQLVTRGGIANVRYGGTVEHFRLNAGTGNDVVNVLSTSPFTEMGVSLKAGGVDHAYVGSAAGSLDGIQGYLLIAGEKGPNGPLDSVVLNDYGDPDANTYRLTANSDQVGGTYSQLTRNGQLLMNAANMKIFGLRAGTGHDTIRVEGVLVPTLVNAGPGNDHVKMFPTATYAPVHVDGQAGSDTLDYLLYSNPVYVNLLTGQATDLASISGFENAFGGQGHDVLVGDAGPNVLRGAGGRDVIIGGAGRDLVDGGDGDDLLVGGPTAYDANQPALLDISAQWSSAAPYAARIALLKSAAYAFNLQDGLTVFGDGALDQHLGGPGMDWFWADMHDVLLDQMPGEQKN
jgi:Ca2+-binding RTX toxin-like protein